MGRATKGAGREYLEVILVALLLAFALRFFVVEAFRIPSGSMIETLLVGDFIFVNKLSYRTEVPFTILGRHVPGGGTTITRWSSPERGDVAVFRYPPDPRVDYIKRIVALAGDTVEVARNELIINGEHLPRLFSRSMEFHDQSCRSERAQLFSEHNGARSYGILIDSGPDVFENYGPVTVPVGHVFAMGDNRDNSSDSRAWGFVPIDHIKGRALFVWLSVDRCSPFIDKIRWSRLGRGVH